MVQLAALMEAVEQVSTFIEATQSYREKCLAAGFTEAAAEQMALDFHRMVMVHSAKQAQS
jgi:hypothetical protein